MFTANTRLNNFAVVLQNVKTFDAAFLQRAANGMKSGLLMTATVSQQEYMTGPRPEKLGVKTGRLRNSVSVATEVVEGGVIGAEGTNVEYGARHEFGFNGTESVKAFTRVIGQLAASKGFMGAGFKAVDTRTVLSQNGKFAGYKESSRKRASGKQKSGLVQVQFVKAHSRKVNYKGKPFVRPAMAKMLPVITGEILKEAMKGK